MPRRVISNLVINPGGAHQGDPLRRNLKDWDLGTRRDPIGRIKPPNSNQYPITITHQLGGSGKGCVRSLDHKGGHDQAVVHLVPLGKGWEGDFVLAPHSEPLHL